MTFIMLSNTIVGMKYKLLVIVFFLSSFNQYASSQKVYNTYKGLIMTGYQGWFNCPTDGAGKNWTHYQSGSLFQPGSCTIDFWPDTSEYPKTYVTSFKFPNGTPASVFSSYDASTVDVHFKWMQEYGIDGAFMQRFIHSLTDPLVKNHYNVVFDAAMTASKKYNRAISIRYDLTGMSPGDTAKLFFDLDAIIAKYDILNKDINPNYLYHNGKPLVAIGGIGMSKDISGTDVGYLDAADVIITGLKARGFSIMIRVVANWRDLSNAVVVQDPADQVQFQRILKTIDIIMPWHVGAYKEASYVSDKWPAKIKGDMDWCKANGIDYVPVIYPGFSRANLKGGEDGSFRPRNKGTFYWLQAQNAINVGAEMLFQAQFDEIDEGTQIFKCVNVVPTGLSPFIPYEDGLQSDYYLWLAGKSGAMLRKEIPFTSTMPVRTINNINTVEVRKQCILFPNPSNGQINIVLPNNKMLASFNVFNSFGSLVNCGNITTNTTTLQLKSIPKGSYILEVNSGSEVYINKLLVQN